MTEHDLKVEHPDKPLAIRRDWYRYGDDGTFRAAGKRVSKEIGTGTDVQVRVWVSDHHKPLKAQKAYVIAVATLGWPEHWTCPNCDERVYEVIGYRNGHPYDTSPTNLKWVPDRLGKAYHKLICIESMKARPYESEAGYPNEQPRQRFMNASDIDVDDDNDDDDYRDGGLPHMFHSVTADEDKELNGKDKDGNDTDPYYLD